MTLAEKVGRWLGAVRDDFRRGISLAERRPRDREELGSSGLQRFRGFVEEEYARDLRGAKAVEIYDRMARSDPQVRATELVVTLPILAGRWVVEPTDSSPKARQIADFTEDSFFGSPPAGMTIAWEDFIRESLLCVRYGYSVFEKVWHVVNGQLRYRKFASRHPRTLQQAREGPWVFDEHDGVKAIRQRAYVDGHPREAEIPIEKALIFTYREEFGNPEGSPGFRPMYKPWFIKDGLLRILSVGFERQAMGIPVGKLPARSVDAADKNRFETLVRSLRTHEEAGIVVPADFEIEMISGDLKGDQLLWALDQMDNQIARSALAQFINLGQQGQGSLALSREQTAFFLMSLRSLGRHIAGIITRFAIPQLVQYNFDSDLFPSVKLLELGTTDEAAVMQTVAELGKAGFIAPDPDLEQHLRDRLQLPPKTEEVRDIKEDREPAGVEAITAEHDRQRIGQRKRIAMAEEDGEALRPFCASRFPQVDA